MTRRRFLHQALAAPALRHAAARAGLAAAGGLVATPAQVWATTSRPPDARLLVVFLRGAYDPLGLMVPTERGFYAEVRPTLAIGGALPLTADWGLNPALGDSLAPLLQRGQACLVPFAGTHNTSRSHFETQDSIELGLAGGVSEAGSAARQSGFLNRLAQVLGAAPGAAEAAPGELAIGFTEQLPLALRGPLQVAHTAVRNAAARGGDPTAAAVQAMYQSHPLQQRVEAGYALRDQLSRQVAEEQAAARSAAPMANSAVPGETTAPATPATPATPAMAATSPAPGMAPSGNEMAAASRQAVSARGFELEARRIGRLMRERYALGFVDIGGWDTHVNQGSTAGTLPGRLQELARGLAALPDALGADAWGKTVVVVVSEFGRTVRENGNRGTDHGHGSAYWVLGGGLKAGAPVRGEQVPLAARHLHQNRDLPVLNDYRGLLAGLMARQFGLGAAALDQVFAGVQPRDLGLL